MAGQRIQDLSSPVDLSPAILWLRNDAKRLLKLIELKQAWYDVNHTQFWADWYTNCFNLLTANDFGLSLWARILDVPLSFAAPSDNAYKAPFGFGGFNKNFTRGNFARTLSGSITLTTEQKRLVLRLRYFQLTTDCAIPTVNAFMRELFKDYGLVYIRDNLDMTMTYVFTFDLPSQLKLVLDQFDLMPRPAGVKFSYIVDNGDNWGFDDTHENFDNGNFGDPGYTEQSVAFSPDGSSLLGVGDGSVLALGETVVVS